MHFASIRHKLWLCFVCGGGGGFKKKKTKQRGGWSQCVCLKFFRPDITSVYKAQWLFAVNRLVCVGVCLFLSFSLSLNLSFHSNGLLAKIMHFPCLIMG